MVAPFKLLHLIIFKKMTEHSMDAWSLGIVTAWVLAMIYVIIKAVHNSFDNKHDRFL